MAAYWNTFGYSTFLSRIYAYIIWKAIAIPVDYRYFRNFYAFFLRRVASSIPFIRLLLPRRIPHRTRPRVRPEEGAAVGEEARVVAEVELEEEAVPFSEAVPSWGAVLSWKTRVLWLNITQITFRVLLFGLFLFGFLLFDLEVWRFARFWFFGCLGRHGSFIIMEK
jgi:hypothetical protein